jgi:hypothetical protein
MKRVSKIILWITAIVGAIAGAVFYFSINLILLPLTGGHLLVEAFAVGDFNPNHIVLVGGGLLLGLIVGLLLVLVIKVLRVLFRI